MPLDELLDYALDSNMTVRLGGSISRVKRRWCFWGGGRSRLGCLVSENSIARLVKLEHGVDQGVERVCDCLSLFSGIKHDVRLTVRDERPTGGSTALQPRTNLLASVATQCVRFKEFKHEIGHVVERAHDES